MSVQVMVVDDETALCDLIAQGLARRGIETITAQSGADALELLAQHDAHAVITDLNMGRIGGVEFCQRAVALRPGLPVIVLTAFGSMENAIAALRAGAYDFISKPVDLDVLGFTAERAIRDFELQREVVRLRKAVDVRENYEELAGGSPAMNKLFSLLDRVADSAANVLITGETGTGKELVACAIHRRSHNARAPFVAVNCAAMPAQLLESEFFGHVRGAFTDAKTGHTGLFEQANGGTVFLDEVGELPLELQPKLLRVLQERKIRPLGATSEVPFDARIVSATNRDLESEVDQGNFREDLLYRLNVIGVDVPPLRVRGNDILILAQRFLEHFSRNGAREVEGFAAPAAEKLLQYSWPGNVRELENCVERAVALAQHNQILLDDLPQKIQSHKSTKFVISAEDSTDLVPMHEVEKRYILRVLAAYGGNKRQAARVLGLDRKTLWRKLKQYGVETGDNTPRAR